MKANNDVQLMIDILKDAAGRSDQESPAHREFHEKRELALIFDMIEAKLIRGEVLRSKEGPPRGAAMWGITLAGREYLTKLKTERNDASWRAKAGKAAWAFGGVLIGILISGTTAVVSAVALNLFKLK